MLFHHKAVLIDDDLVLLGSVNLFEKSLREDSEDLVALRSEHIVQRFDELCDQHPQFRPF